MSRLTKQQINRIAAIGFFSLVCTVFTASALAQILAEVYGSEKVAPIIGMSLILLTLAGLVIFFFVIAGRLKKISAEENDDSEEVVGDDNSPNFFEF